MYHFVLASLACLVLTLATASAAVVTKPIRGVVEDGDGMALATIGGSVTYDDAALALGAATPIGGSFIVTPASTGVPIPVAIDDPAFDPAIVLVPGSGGALAFFDISAISPLGRDVEAFSVPGTGEFEVFRGGTFALVADGSLEVVPLPAAAWMFGAGVVALAALRRRVGR